MMHLHIFCLKEGAFNFWDELFGWNKNKRFEGEPEMKPQTK